MNTNTLVQAGSGAMSADVWTAIGTMAAAFIALVTVIFAGKDARKTRKEAAAEAAAARADAKADRDQQAKIFQGTVMSNCTQEFFAIRAEAAKEWRDERKHPPEPGKEVAREHYAERMYGLHFEEYHLFRQQAIPCYVYAIWLKAIRDEIESAPKKDSHSQYPPLDLTEHLGKDSAEDFHQFFMKVLKAKTHKEIEQLVMEERKKGGYE